MKSELVRSDSGRSYLGTPRETGERRVTSSRGVAVVHTARQGDERLTQQFLTQAGYPEVAAEHLAQIERPGYDASERLLLRHGSRILAHLRCYPRSTRLADQFFAMTQLCDWVAQGGIPGEQLASVWDTAQAAARTEGVWGLLTSCRPPAGEASGNWVMVRQTPWYELTPTRLLAHLNHTRASRAVAPPLLARGDKPPIQVRVWRQVEQAALRRLYQRHALPHWGVQQRTDDYWRWLIARRGFDDIYVAVEGTEDTGFDDPDHAIVGYAVLRGHHVVEWVGEEPRVFRRFLRRLCQDAMEHDVVSLRLPLPWGPPAAVRRCRELLEMAGRPAPAMFAWRAKMFHPLRFLDSLRPLIAARAESGGHRHGCELGFEVHGRRFLLTVEAGEAHLLPDRLGRSHLRLDCRDLLGLLLGTVTVTELLEEERVVASTRLARELASLLFPPIDWSISPWDSLPSLEA